MAIDEAHGPIGPNGAAHRVFAPAAKGYLLVTWRPEELSADTLAALDAVITLGSPDLHSTLIDLAAAVAETPRTEIARLLYGPTGRAILAWRQQPGQAVAFAIGSRTTAHLRHEHKYGVYGVEPARRFHFRTEPDTPTGAVAANLAELEAELTRCDEGVLRHHCPEEDFSRWGPGSSATRRSRPPSGPPRPPSRRGAQTPSSSRCAWRSSPRSSTGVRSERPGRGTPCA